MAYCVNYINDHILDLCQNKQIYIKYPGRMFDLQTLEKLYEKKYKIVLHGIIPSSGSILDPNLCENLDNFMHYIINTKQKWLSFHFDYREKYNDQNYMRSLEKNLGILRAKFPNLQILIENVPPVSQMEPWYIEPKTFNSVLKKYDLKMLLDISHAYVSADYMGISFEEYLSQFDLDRVVEIHFSGTGINEEGKLFDAHLEGGQQDFDCFEYAIKKCPNVQMITLEYSPIVDPQNQSENLTAYNNQQQQIQKLEQIYYTK